MVERLEMQQADVPYGKCATAVLMVQCLEVSRILQS